MSAKMASRTLSSRSIIAPVRARVLMDIKQQASCGVQSVQLPPAGSQADQTWPRGDNAIRAPRYPELRAGYPDIISQFTPMADTRVNKAGVRKVPKTDINGETGGAFKGIARVRSF